MVFCGLWPARCCHDIAMTEVTCHDFQRAAGEWSNPSQDSTNAESEAHYMQTLWYAVCCIETTLD